MYQRKDKKIKMITSLYSLLYKTKNNLIVYRFIKIFLNLYYPIYCRLNRDYRYIETKENVIISLTTFPARINSVWLIIETLLRQTYRPQKIILWLAKSQFDSKEKLPKKLLKQEKRGLEIRFCEDDLRSHKKYYYTMKNYPDYFIITVDDDTFYPENLVENLFAAHNRNPGSICCNLGHSIVVKDGKIAPYKEWKLRAEGCDEPSHFLVPIGCEGVLYPPNSLNNNIFDKKQITELCFLADDLWLKAMATLNNVKAVKCQSNTITYVNLLTSEISSLNKINVGQNMNDKQMENLLNQYPELINKWKEG